MSVSKHTCHAENCEAQTPRRHLMCPRHWRLVDADTKRMVYLHYTKGQENGSVTPKAEWFTWARKAVYEVKMREREIDKEYGRLQWTPG